MTDIVERLRDAFAEDPNIEELGEAADEIERLQVQSGRFYDTIVRLSAELDAAKAECREKLAQFMLKHSFATGHGDGFDDLLGELDWQIAELKGDDEPVEGDLDDVIVNIMPVDTPIMRVIVPGEWRDDDEV